MAISSWRSSVRNSVSKSRAFSATHCVCACSNIESSRVNKRRGRDRRPAPSIRDTDSSATPDDKRGDVRRALEELPQTDEIPRLVVGHGVLQEAVDEPDCHLDVGQKWVKVGLPGSALDPPM